MCHVVFTVAYDGSDCKPFDVVCSFCTVAVGYVVDGAFVILLKYIDVDYVFAHKFFVGYGSDHVTPVPVEDDHIIDVRTACHEFVFL